MKDSISLVIDGQKISAAAGQTILQAADAAGIYVPRLCWMKGLTPAGHCRVCMVSVNGRAQAACTYPVSTGMIVENDTEPLRRLRRDIIDMLFVEGNHFCMFCEKSGACELQALAYRFGISAPRYPYVFPRRDVDASHPEILIDRNRCILCSRCVRASREQDGKHLFGFVGRSHDKRLAVDSDKGLAGTDASAGDHAIQACPTGSLLQKRIGFAIPVGQRKYDQEPIGCEISNEERIEPSSKEV